MKLDNPGANFTFVIRNFEIIPNLLNAPKL